MFGSGPWSGWSCVEGGDAENVVDAAGDEEPGPVAGSADVAGLASAGDGLDPAEGFLDPFPYSLTDRVPFVAGGAPVDRGTIPGCVRRNVRRDVHLSEIRDEVFGV